MATPLIFRYDGIDIPCRFSKVDRSKLYGYVEKVVLDEEGQPCGLATLASDGKTLMGSGDVTFAYFDPEGGYCTKQELKAVDDSGEELTPAVSSLKAPILLDRKATVEEYLSHIIRAVYLIESEALTDSLLENLHSGVIYAFEFSYRGGLEADEAFLLEAHDGTIWMTLGRETDVRLIGISERLTEEPEADTEVDEEEEESLMDFALI